MKTGESKIFWVIRKLLPRSDWMPFGLALAVVMATACSPPAMDEPDLEPPTTAVAQGSSIQNNLQRLGEPSLAENCSGEYPSYRLLKLDTDRYVAAVRVSWDANKGAYGGAYRSVFSSSPTMAKSSEGHVDERMWSRIEAEFGYADFWNLESEREVSGVSEPSLFLEACVDGEYHWLQRRLGDTWLSRIVQIFTLVGKLEWLETGR